MMVQSDCQWPTEREKRTYSTFPLLVLTFLLSLINSSNSIPINRQAGISENVYITVQNDTYGNEQRVCSIESMTYEDGESIPTSSPCEHCICRPPGFACTIISCDYRPGCKALKRSNQCCPEYQCECEKDGKIYQNGEKILDDNNPCEVCYCQGGDVVCAVIDCYWRSDCQPRYIENRCCPLYDHCPPPSDIGPILPTTRVTTTTTTPGPISWFNLSTAVETTSSSPKPLRPFTTTTEEVPIVVSLTTTTTELTPSTELTTPSTAVPEQNIFVQPIESQPVENVQVPGSAEQNEINAETSDVVPPESSSSVANEVSQQAVEVPQIIIQPPPAENEQELQSVQQVPNIVVSEPSNNLQVPTVEERTPAPPQAQNQQVELVQQPSDPIPPIQGLEVVQAVEPSQPIEPVQSLEVVQAVEPSQLIEPVQSLEVQAVEPIQPIEPVQSLEGVQSGEPSQPIEPVQSLEVQAVEPSQPIEPVQSLEGVQSVEASQPFEPVQSLEVVQIPQTQSVQPVEPVQSVEALQDIEPSHPIEPVQSVEGTQALETFYPGHSVPVVQAVETYLPVEPVQSLEVSQVSKAQSVQPVEELQSPLQPFPQLVQAVPAASVSFVPELLESPSPIAPDVQSSEGVVLESESLLPSLVVESQVQDSVQFTLTVPEIIRITPTGVFMTDLSTETVAQSSSSQQQQQQYPEIDNNIVTSAVSVEPTPVTETPSVSSEYEIASTEAELQPTPGNVIVQEVPGEIEVQISIEVTTSEPSELQDSVDEAQAVDQKPAVVTVVSEQQLASSSDPTVTESITVTVSSLPQVGLADTTLIAVPQEPSQSPGEAYTSVRPDVVEQPPQDVTIPAVAPDTSRPEIANLNIDTDLADDVPSAVQAETAPTTVQPDQKIVVIESGPIEPATSPPEIVTQSPEDDSDKRVAADDNTPDEKIVVIESGPIEPATSPPEIVTTNPEDNSDKHVAADDIKPDEKIVVIESGPIEPATSPPEIVTQNPEDDSDNRVAADDTRPDEKIVVIESNPIEPATSPPEIVTTQSPEDDSDKRIAADDNKPDEKIVVIESGPIEPATSPPEIVTVNPEDDSDKRVAADDNKPDEKIVVIESGPIEPATSPPEIANDLSDDTRGSGYPLEEELQTTTESAPISLAPDVSSSEPSSEISSTIASVVEDAPSEILNDNPENVAPTQQPTVANVPFDPVVVPGEVFPNNDNSPPVTTVQPVQSSSEPPSTILPESSTPNVELVPPVNEFSPRPEEIVSDEPVTELVTPNNEPSQEPIALSQIVEDEPSQTPSVIFEPPLSIFYLPAPTKVETDQHDETEAPVTVPVRTFEPPKVQHDEVNNAEPTTVPPQVANVNDLVFDNVESQALEQDFQIHHDDSVQDSADEEVVPPVTTTESSTTTSTTVNPVPLQVAEDNVLQDNPEPLGSGILFDGDQAETTTYNYVDNDDTVLIQDEPELPETTSKPASASIVKNGNEVVDEVQVKPEESSVAIFDDVSQDQLVNDETTVVPPPPSIESQKDDTENELVHVGELETSNLLNDDIVQHDEPADAQDETVTSLNDEVATTENIIVTNDEPDVATTDLPPESKYRLDLSIFEEEEAAAPAQVETTVASSSSSSSSSVDDNLVVFDEVPAAKSIINPISYLNDEISGHVWNVEDDGSGDYSTVPSAYRHHHPSHFGSKNEEGSGENAATVVAIVNEEQVLNDEESTVSSNFNGDVVSVPPIANQVSNEIVKTKSKKVPIPPELVRAVDPISPELQNEENGRSDHTIQEEAETEVARADESWFWRTFSKIMSISDYLRSSRRPRRSTDSQDNTKKETEADYLHENKKVSAKYIKKIAHSIASSAKKNKEWTTFPRFLLW